jgi:hypothetical protein
MLVARAWCPSRQSPPEAPYSSSWSCGDIVGLRSWLNEGYLQAFLIASLTVRPGLPLGLVLRWWVLAIEASS